MAKINEAELGDDFSYILRIADSDVDGLKPIIHGLTSVKGIGVRTSMLICDMAEVDGYKLGGHLSNDEQESIEKKLLMNLQLRFLGG